MYDVSKDNLGSSLGSTNPVAFSQETINQILDLVTKATSNATASVEKVTASANAPVTVASGTTMLQVALEAGKTTKIDLPSNLPVIILEGATSGAELVLKDGTSTIPSTSNVADRVVVTGGGNNNITVQDGKNSKIVASVGNDTITTGSGSDTIVAGGGNDSISGGAGFDVVQVKGTSANLQVTVKSDGSLELVNNGGEIISLQGVQYVALDNGDAIIAAQDTVEAAVATLYKSVLGRTAEADGLQFWFDNAHNGMSLTQIADAFANSDEGKAHNAGLTNDQFIEQLYMNNFGRAAEAGAVDFWKEQIASGRSLGDIAKDFAGVAAQNLSGDMSTEITTVGVIKVIDGNI